MKRIAIFADGTWNSPEKDHTTNVLELARSIRPHASDGVEQIAFYDWGIGTDRKRITGGITGAGIDKNIMDCYRFLVHNFEPGDQLFFFGFSRGAYTVRSLAGFIRNCGLLGRVESGHIVDAYKLYRKRSSSSGPNAEKAVTFRKQHAIADITEIEFVGVWDTVGALGIPVPFWGTLGEKEFLFHDTEPSKIVRHARHAVSIDETREDFQPTLWDEKEGLDLQQVWFAGAHSDVGGGGDDRGLSYCACAWMVREAHGLGLEFEPHLKTWIKANPKASFRSSRRGIYRIRREAVREITGPLHASVKKRWQADTDGYRKKSKALSRLLESVDGDWSQLEVVE
jgi:uncharacterized protein (DUF2235 family)